MKIGVIGLGYVGLPLLLASVEAGFEAKGFDLDAGRVNEILDGYDRTNETNLTDVKLNVSSSSDILEGCNLIVITVPTPVTINKMPDVSYLELAVCEAILKVANGGVVVVESTVYPGLTRTLCESAKNKIGRRDVHFGYSPERVNPGDKSRDFKTTDKVVAGCCDKISKLLFDYYRRLITAPVHLAKSIEEAEAAKVIENTQRDVNIALMNELAIMFEKANIDLNNVLELASTKWNFLPFKPGLVGGHCISVDPYYLQYFANQYDAPSSVVAIARHTNELYIERCAARLLKSVSHGSKLLVLGVTFKPNTPDIRNSGVLKVLRVIGRYYQVYVYDPVFFCRKLSWDVFRKELGAEVSVSIVSQVEADDYDVITKAVDHQIFDELNIDHQSNLVKFLI